MSLVFCVAVIPLPTVSDRMLRFAAVLLAKICAPAPRLLPVMLLPISTMPEPVLTTVAPDKARRVLKLIDPPIDSKTKYLKDDSFYKKYLNYYYEKNTSFCRAQFEFSGSFRPGSGLPQPASQDRGHLHARRCC